MAEGLITRRGGVSAPEPWVRNPSWPACEANAGDNKIVGLWAVFPEGGNFFAMTISGAYTINYGDGTTTNYASGATANYEYDYNDADLAGTDAPVTFTASTDTVNRTAHGYSNGMQVRFYNIVTTTGISPNNPYFVINASANSFQISETLGGSAVDLVNDGSATLLPYKIATVTITPQAANNLTNVNFGVKHNQAGLVNNYSTGWLDVAIASSTITTLTFAGGNVRHRYVERLRVNETGNITSLASLCLFCQSLQKFVILTNTSNVTNTSGMFRYCFSLQSVPLFNTTNVTNMSNMFEECFSLQSVPLFNTANVTNMQQMFFICRSLQSVPLFNTASVTNMSQMFSDCTSLQSVPLFNTASVTTMSQMFNNSRSFTSVPLFNTASVTNMFEIFRACDKLELVPLLNTSNVTNMESMFRFCAALTSVPALNTSAVTSSANFSNIFNGCSNLSRIQAEDFNYTFSVANCKLSAAALDEIYTNLPVVVGQTITVTGNYGTAGDDPTIATNKGWTVTG